MLVYIYRQLIQPKLKCAVLSILLGLSWENLFSQEVTYFMFLAVATELHWNK